MSWTVSTSVNHSQSGNSEWRHNTARLELMKFYKNAGRVDKNVTFVDNRFMLIETVISITFAMNREYAVYKVVFPFAPQPHKLLSKYRSC